MYVDEVSLCVSEFLFISININCAVACKTYEMNRVQYNLCVFMERGDAIVRRMAKKRLNKKVAKYANVCRTIQINLPFTVISIILTNIHAKVGIALIVNTLGI